MSFKVRTQALRTAKDALAALSTDVAVADTYKSTYLKIDGEDGRLFAHVDNVNDSVVARLDDVLDRLKTVLANSGMELAAVAKWYDETDAATRERLDAQIPPDAPLKPGQAYDDSVPFEDTVPEDPGDYKPPADHDAPPGDDEPIILAPGPIGEPRQPSDPYGGVA